MIFRAPSTKPGSLQRGLTLIEILVATSLLVMITVGLLLMFNQTQKAFRGSLTSVDVLEGGRTALDILTSDIGQLSASKMPGEINVFAGLQSATPPAFNTIARTNYYLQNLFFLTRDVNWNGIGYKVLNPNELNANSVNTTNGVVVGTLYRFATNASRLANNQFVKTFNRPPRELMNNPSGRQLSRIIDGVVHFRVLFYNEQGRLYSTNSVTDFPTDNFNIAADYNIVGQKRSVFRDDRLPAYVEIELGILEPVAVDQVRAIPEINIQQRRDFVTTNANKVHFYRRQIPIRTALR